MEALSHLNPHHKVKLSCLDDESPFQFLSGFTDFYKKFYNDYLEIFYSHSLNAFIPIRFFHSRVFKLGQILHAPIRKNEELDTEEQRVFFRELLQFFEQNKICDRLVQPHPYGILNAVPKGADYCRFGTYVNDLKNQNEEDLFAKFNPKYQKAIHHSQKHNAKVLFGYDIMHDFYSCYKSTMDRVGMKAETIGFFEALIKYLGEDHATPGVVYDEENSFAIGCLFIIHTKYAALCTHAGSQGETKLYGAMKFLHWETMLRMKNAGVKKYDLVGVRVDNTDPTLEGIFKFKKGFGGELKEGYLWKINVRPMRSRMYDLLLKIRLPNKPLMKDIIDQVNS